MVRHDLSSSPEDGLLSVDDLVPTDHVLEPASGLEAKLERSRRLNEYYNQVVAELQASLAEIGVEDSQLS
jgi:hypothetical protein